MLTYPNDKQGNPTNNEAEQKMQDGQKDHATSKTFIYNLGNTYSQVNISDNARVILGDAPFQNFSLDDDVSTLRAEIDHRRLRYTRPRKLHVDFPDVWRYESRYTKRAREARCVSPQRTPSKTYKLQYAVLVVPKYDELIMLCEHNRLADLRILLETRRFDVKKSAVASAMRDALMAAAASGFAEIVETLLLHGFDPNNGEPDTGETVLHVTIANGNEKITRMLLEQGANVNALGGPAETYLKLALLVEKPSVAIIELLLNAGAHIQDAGMYPSSLQASVFRDNRSLLGKMCSKLSPLGINAAHPRHGSALQAATFYGRLEAARMLLDFGAKSDSYSGPYGSPIHAAVHFGHAEICQLLLRSEANTTLDTYQAPYGTPLHIAARNGDHNVLRLLLAKGAHVGYAENCQHHESLAAAAAYSGSVFALDILLDSGLRLDQYDIADRIQTCVSMAIRGDHGPMACALIDHGLDINGGASAYYGLCEAPVAAAAAIGDIEMVKYLICLRADPHGIALEEAATGGHQDVVVYLSRRCASAFRASRDTALARAVEAGHRVVASYLVLEGAKFGDRSQLLQRITTQGSIRALDVFVELVGKNDIASNDRMNALNSAIMHGRRKMLLHLLSTFPDLPGLQHKLDTTQDDPLVLAVLSQTCSTVKAFLEAGMNASGGHAHLHGFQNPLAAAIAQQDICMTQLLLDHGANANAKVDITIGERSCCDAPLLSAAICLCPPGDIALGYYLPPEDSTPRDIVKALLDNGADPSVRFVVPEVVGEAEESEEIVRLAVRNRAIGLRPLSHALNRGLEDVVVALVQKGARFSPYDYPPAKSLLNFEMLTLDVQKAQMLVNAGAPREQLAEEFQNILKPSKQPWQEAIEEVAEKLGSKGKFVRYLADPKLWES